MGIASPKCDLSFKRLTKDNKPYVNRKVREIFRALEFEKNYGKEYILEQFQSTPWCLKNRSSSMETAACQR